MRVTGAAHEMCSVRMVLDDVELELELEDDEELVAADDELLEVVPALEPPLPPPPPHAVTSAVKQPRINHWRTTRISMEFIEALNIEKECSCKYIRQRPNCRRSGYAHSSNVR